MLIAFEPISFGIVSFLIFLFFHVLLWQNKRIKYRGVYLIWKLAIINFVLISLLGFYFFYYSINEYVWVSGPFYFCLIMVYTHLYVGIDKSVSIRLMGELVTSSNNTLKWEELDNLYSPIEMVKPRLDLLVDKNWLVIRNGKYLCLPKIETLVKINILFQKLYRLDKTG